MRRVFEKAFPNFIGVENPEPPLAKKHVKVRVESQERETWFVNGGSGGVQHNNNSERIHFIALPREGAAARIRERLLPTIESASLRRDMNVVLRMWQGL